MMQKNTYGNHNETRSARVMIKFPIEKDGGWPEEIEPNGGSAPQYQTNIPDSGQIQNDHLLFQGVVRDDNHRPVKGAAVMLFACYKGGEEQPVGYSFTDSEGAYLLNVPEPPDRNSIAWFRVRAGISVQTTEEASPQIYTATSSPNQSFYSFIQYIHANPGKTIPELLSGIYKYSPNE